MLYSQRQFPYQLELIQASYFFARQWAQPIFWRGVSSIELGISCGCHSRSQRQSRSWCYGLVALWAGGFDILSDSILKIERFCVPVKKNIIR